MSKRTETRATRRTFLMGSAWAGLGAGLGWGGPPRIVAASANEKVRIALVGVGGMGKTHVEDEVVKQEQVVAPVDVDENHLNAASEIHPGARKFSDFRAMFDAMGQGIDAVICATPDHTHAVVTARALREGKHVYTQKPLTHTVYEASVIADLARKNPKLVTQMGNQGHSSEGTRQVVEIVRSGVLGQIKEVHAWTDRPIWPQGIDRPEGSQEPPSSLSWDLWLGPMPARPYHEGTYHPFNWRGWWDFGTGALGDMACHIVDAAFWALDLRDPTSITAECEGLKSETAPKSSVIRYEFPARGDRAPVSLTWYDGGKLPPASLIEQYKITSTRTVREGALKREARASRYADNGSILIGEKGLLALNDTSGARWRLYPEADFQDFQPPAKTLARSPGHMLDWIDGIKNGRQACSNFEYATALTGMVLLGNLAIHAGKPIQWDAAQMKAVNAPELDALIKPDYRPGWEL